MKDLKSLLIGVMKMTWKPTFQRCCGKLILCFRSHIEGTHLCSFLCKSNHSAFIIPPAQQSCWGGILVSPRPSVRPRCWEISGIFRRSAVLKTINRNRWKLPIKENNCKKMTAYVGAECGASSFTWYLYQICNTDVRLSVRLSVHPSCIPCPLCSSYSSGWIHLIFMHLIK